MSASIEESAFPVLSQSQMSAVADIGERVTFVDGEELITQGQKDYPFYVIESGEVRIVERGQPHDREIVRHGPASFTGDIDMLTGRSAVIAAIAEGPVHAYRLCSERFRRLLGECPPLSDLLLDAFQTRRRMLEKSDFVGVRVIGETGARETSRLREFFYKNHIPHTFTEAAVEEGRSLLDRLGASELARPVVHCNGHTVGNPSLPKLAECIGISRSVDGQLFDLVVVGAGPSGLAAAVYAASEGLRTLVIDRVGPGGQAGSSSKIENFMGFPSGLSGNELARRGYLQALKFGARFIAPITVQSIETHGPFQHDLRLCTGQTARAKCVLVATGVTYRQLDLEGGTKWEGAGLYYAATSVEARVCDDSTAVVVGGGNSAGQAAMFLANSAREVVLMIRGDDLAKSMSSYLCERVLKHPKIQLRKHSQLVRVDGDQSVRSVTAVDGQTGESSTIDCAALFIFIGARPHTDFLPSQVELDEKGFVRTGAAVGRGGSWPLDRPPCDLETSVPGIMAAGDARAGTTKRCGFAVGDGSLAVACVHRHLSGQP